MCLKRKLKIVKCLSLTTARPGVRLDERTAALIMMKCLPLSQLIQALYPDMYKVPTAHTAPASSHCCCSLLLLTSLSRVAGGRTRAGGHQGGRGGKLCASARETAAQVNLTILMHENCFMKQEIDVNSTSSAEHVAMNGAYLLDAGDSLLLFLGKVLQPFFCEKVRHCTAPLQGYIVELWLFRCLESANLWMLTRT